MSELLRQPERPSAAWWRVGLRLLQALVTAGLMLWLLRQVEWASVAALLRQMRWEMIALAVVCLLVNHAINVLRWRYLLGRPAPGLGALTRWYAIGLFSNNFLPTGIGGDGVRVALSSRAVALGRAMLAVLLDRLVGLAALSVLVVLGLLAGLPDGLRPGADLRVGLGRLNLAALALCGLALCGLAVWVLTGLRPRLAARLRGWEFPRWSAWQWLVRLGAAYAISAFAQLWIVAAIWAMLAALRVAAPWPAAVWLVALSSLSLLLPIAVNGMGVVEGVYVLVLASYGVAASTSFSLALAVRLLGLLISLSGGALLLGRPALEAEVRQ